MEKEIRRTFRYNGNHPEDECYMQKMCRQGWAARSLTEGFWKFERCKPDEFCYRICYLRGKSRTEIEGRLFWPSWRRFMRELLLTVDWPIETLSESYHYVLCGAGNDVTLLTREFLDKSI